MLDAFVIDEIRRRERERGREDQPVVQVPVPEPEPPSGPEKPGDKPSEGGVIIIDYGRAFEGC
jgi:hypothetical protein